MLPKCGEYAAGLPADGAEGRNHRGDQITSNPLFGYGGINAHRQRRAGILIAFLGEQRHDQQAGMQLFGG